jgi:hypothetical protein
VLAIEDDGMEADVKYETVSDKVIPAAWRVEAINYEGDGEGYVAIFVGPDAQSRAEEYAAWKNQANELAMAS